MVNSLAKAIMILSIIKEADESCSISYLSSKLALPPSTVHRILETLCEYKFIRKNPESKKYGLGPALISLGRSASQNTHIQILAHGILQELARDSEEDAFFIVPTGNKGLVLDRVDGPGTLKVVENIGVELYLHCGAMRKSLLAFQSEKFIEDYITEVSQLQNVHPQINRNELLVLLENIRKEKVAVSYGDYAKGTIGIGSAVFNATGMPVASIGLVVSSSLIDNNIQLEKSKQLVIMYAQKFSESLGFSGK